MLAPDQPERRDEAEYDEDGRRYVFRFAPFTPQKYAIDRERIFAYRRRKKLPTMRERELVRDLRNAASFFEDVRDIQTHPDVEPAAKAVDDRKSRHLRSA